MPFETSPVLDDVLLDVVVSIELTNNDRRLVDRRYGILREHLLRDKSSLADLLERDPSRIYAQGSIALGAVIVDGAADDRFDLDAIVEMNVPEAWDASIVLDELFDALQGFPGAEEIERCTRCVQIRFARMHIDVTPLDPHKPMFAKRAGHIFHSPDHGVASRVESNPWGFVDWYRSTVTVSNQKLGALLEERRTRPLAVDRLMTREILAEMSQENLPPTIPPRIDSEQTLALKLFKRFLNLRYLKLPLKRPISIYLSLNAARMGNLNLGLTEQLIGLAKHCLLLTETAMAFEQYPDERNPRYSPDRINDRWPPQQQPASRSADLKEFAAACEHLVSELQRAKTAPIADISAIVRRLFGEQVGQRAIEEFVAGYDRSAGQDVRRFEKGVGTLLSTPALVATTKSAAAPPQSFHSGLARK